MENCKKACLLARNAIIKAEDKLDECDETTYKEAKAIIQILNENKSIWKEELDKTDPEYDEI
jgi:hypothetical protein